MAYVSSTDPKFLSKLESWLQSVPEILVLIRYSHAGGNKEFEFYSDYSALLDRIRLLPPRTCIIAFKEHQLPIRGIMDDNLLAHCLAIIPNDAEYLIVETNRRSYGKMSWFHDCSGQTHECLKEDLEESRGTPVAVGLYPPWLKDTEEVISAVVPDVNGVVSVGVY